MSKILQVSCHRCKKAIKIAFKSVGSFSVRENWALYELVMAKNKSNRLHNKGCYHKRQYNLTFFCTKRLSIQTKSAWQPLLLFANDLSFTFMQESKFFSLFPFIFSFGKHHVVRKDLGTYIQLDMGSKNYYCWHHPWDEYVGRRNYKPLSFYVSGWNVLLMCMRWVLTIIEDYMMVEYVDLLKRLRHVTLPEKMMNCSCKVDWEHCLLVSNRVYTLYFDVVMNCYLFMRNLW